MKSVRVIFFILTLLSTLEIHAECNRLTVTANSNYPPYSWGQKNEQQQDHIAGAFIDLTVWLGEQLDLVIEPVYTGTWARTQEEVASGHVDLLAGVFYTEERTQKYDYIYPEISTIETVVLMNNSRPFNFQTLNDLKTKQGVTLINNSLGQNIDQQRNEFVVYEVARIEQALHMLSERRVDYVAFEHHPSINYIRKLKLHNLQRIGPAVGVEKIYLAISQKSECNNQALRDKLSFGIQKIHALELETSLIQQADDIWQELISNQPNTLTGAP